MQVEAFTPVRLTISGQVKSGAGTLGGFLCTTTGTVTLYDGTDATGTAMVSSFPVTAGVFHPAPFSFGTGLYATLGGGAAGTFGVRD
jgi:hypothetical protein